MIIHFEKVTQAHIKTIFGWLTEPFVQEFWDNTQEHKDDILKFVNGRKEPSNYCDGKYVYWIASCDGGDCSGAGKSRHLLIRRFLY